MRETTAHSHIDETTLSLYIDNLLSKEEEAMVEKHLEICEDRRCSDILNMFVEVEKMAEEIEKKKELEPANNIDYRGTLKRLSLVASLFVAFIVLPKFDHQFDQEVIFKGIIEEKNILETSFEYWEKLFNKYFGELKEKK